LAKKASKTKKVRIAIDASGGEYAPREVVKGAIKAANEYKVDIILVGKKSVLHLLGGKQFAKLGITVVPASQTIGYHEHPVEAVRGKTKSSIVIGTSLVKEGKADAFVSAGNTGAVLFASLMILGKIEGINRPGICSVIKLHPAIPSLLIDAGANADCRPIHILQFAQLGDIYARKILLIKSPRIGLLSNGEEETKGNRLTRDSYQLLKKSKLNFIGNIEGHDIASRTSDVVVTDGFTGNIILKTFEGLGDSLKKIRKLGSALKSDRHLRGLNLLADAGLGFLTRGMDYREYGGACLLGVNGNIIIAHGRSQAVAIKNAIGLAKRTAEQNICRQIKGAMNEE